MTTKDLFSDALQNETISFTPTRQAGLARLEQFVSRTGQHYAKHRNYDLGSDQRSNVSALSPWIRHRLITEDEVLRATLARHSPPAAEKFVQEVFWRTYFKGWLHQHPSVWTSYLQGRDDALHQTAGSTDYADAVAGRTGIACFDHWCRELVDTGYLHNHARMWFASIWIFTLRLPWELGADFFLRHLLDGDPASNTLSWRWVGGLHTKGKTYLARPSNIAKYTDGRFNPHGQLATTAEPLSEHTSHPISTIPPADAMPATDYLLLVTPEDCQIETLLPHAPLRRLGLALPHDGAGQTYAPNVRAFREAAVESVCGTKPLHHSDWEDKIIAAAEDAGAKTIVTGFAPVGPIATLLSQTKLGQAGLTVHQIRRGYDNLTWPSATKGFFSLKKKIPHILQGLDLTR